MGPDTDSADAEHSEMIKRKRDRAPNTDMWGNKLVPDGEQPKRKRGRPRKQLPAGDEKGPFVADSAAAGGRSVNEKNKKKGHRRDIKMNTPNENSDSEWCLEGDKEPIEPECDVFEALSQMVIKFQYGEFWTAENERALQQSWSDADAKMVNSSYGQECVLWTRAAFVFRTFPPYILPFGVEIYKIETEEDSVSKNINWPGHICTDLAMIMCCPIFYGNLEYFRFVLGTSLYHRVKKLCDREKPSLTQLTLDDRRKTQILVDVRDGLKSIGEEASWTPGLQKVVSETLGRQLKPENPPHVEFLQYLRFTVQKGWSFEKTGGNKLATCDLQAIIQAWDLYAASKAVKLPTMEEYKKQFNAKHSFRGRFQKSEQTVEAWFKKTKKDFILDDRRFRAQIANEAKFTNALSSIARESLRGSTSAASRASTSMLGSMPL